MTESANEDMDRMVSLVDYIMGTLAGVELAQAPNRTNVVGRRHGLRNRRQQSRAFADD